MTVLWWARRTLLPCMFGAAVLALIVGGIGPANGAECKNRGDLDKRYCDDNDDLVADTPKETSRQSDPDTLVFSYTPVEDPSVYENVFKEFMDYLGKKTGKPVKWYGADSYAAQVEAMRSGRLHVAGIAAGATVFGVNLGGFVPVALMGRKDGTFGYKLQLITQADSSINRVSDLKGKKVAHVTPSSNSGHQAPKALFQALGVVPDKDYKVTFSGKHDNSIMGVANKDYDAAPIASTVLDRMVARGVVDRSKLRVIWESQLFPSTAYGFAHNLKPDLQKKVAEAFLTFDWKGTMLAKEFKDVEKFIAISYKDAWVDIRTIQKVNDTKYTDDALKALKAPKVKKKEPEKKKS